MDEFLALVGVQAMKYAVRSGIVLTSSYAISQMSRLAKSEDNQAAYAEMKELHDHFEMKVKIITPAIDLIDLKSGRGNVFLESASPMTKALQRDIAALANRIQRSIHIHDPEFSSAIDADIIQKAMREEIHGITADLRQMLDRIDREIPLLQLAITASGEALSTTLPPSVSPSRLLQASTLLTVGDIQFAQNPSSVAQIGPMFYLSMYMLFVGHAPKGNNEQQYPAYGIGHNERKPLWQETIHKARVRLLRVPVASDEEQHRYRYQLEIYEDQDDGRAHETEDDRWPSNGTQSGSINVIEVNKIFYTDAGRLLNLGSEDTLSGSSPILLLKRAMQSPGNDGSTSEVDDEQSAIDEQLLTEAQIRRPQSRPKQSIGLLHPGSHLDPEWLAFEMYQDHAAEVRNDTSDDDDDDNSGDEGTSGAQKTDERLGYQHLANGDSPNHDIDGDLQSLSLGTQTTLATDSSTNSLRDASCTHKSRMPESPLGAITTSLSLFEMLIRLAGLQECQQTSHLSIPDHLLAFFLEETPSTGVGRDSQRKTRAEAKSKVGFDPYAESHD